MRIVLLDLYTNGHHLKYVSALVEYLQNKNYEVMFITWRDDERVEQMLKSHYPELTLRFLAEGSDLDLSSNPFVRQFQMARILGRGFKIAKQWSADVVHLLYIETFLSVYLWTFKYRHDFDTFGTLFWLSLIMEWGGRGGLARRIYHKLSPLLLKDMLERRALAGIFIHNVYPKGVRETLDDRVEWISRYQDKVFILHDPIYDDFYAYCTQDEAREKLSLPADAPILLFFGELTEGKGLDILFEAIRSVKEEFYLVIAGRPIYFSREHIHHYKKQVRNPYRVIDRLGFIPEEEVPYYFMSADAIVMPYRRQYDVGTSGILMQACSARKPIICSDVGTIGQLTRLNSLGIVVTPESPHELAEGISGFLAQRVRISEEVEVSAVRCMAEAKWERIADIIEHAYKNP